MEIKSITKDIAEVISDSLIILNTDDGLNLVGEAYYSGFDKVIIHESSITPKFFDLKTRMAGEILQKFSNYRMKLAIVGDFSSNTSKSLSDFIFESNKLGHVNFVASREEAIEKLSKECSASTKPTSSSQF